MRGPDRGLGNGLHCGRRRQIKWQERIDLCWNFARPNHSELNPNNCLNNLRSSARFLSPQKLASGWPTILRLMATCPFPDTYLTVETEMALAEDLPCWQ
jgi:hypothetical protein